MKTTILAAAAVLTLGLGSAFAEENGDAIANTQFTSLPGVLAQAPAQNATSAFAQSGQVHVYTTQAKQDGPVFQPGWNNG